MCSPISGKSCWPLSQRPVSHQYMHLQKFCILVVRITKCTNILFFFFWLLWAVFYLCWVWMRWSSLSLYSSPYGAVFQTCGWNSADSISTFWTKFAQGLNKLARTFWSNLTLCFSLIALSTQKKRTSAMLCQKNISIQRCNVV